MAEPIRTAASLARAVRRYHLLSGIYGVNAALGSAVARAAVARAAVRPGEHVLELAVGTGVDLVALAGSAGSRGIVTGFDLARGMVRVAAARVARARPAGRVRLGLADARALPLRAGSVDVVFGSRLLDLLDTPFIPVVLEECRRVLSPGGRIVLVNMSKPGPATSLFERCYQALPLFGGWLFVSRPVLAAPLLEAAGFAAVAREYHASFPVGSEIAWALNP